MIKDHRTRWVAPAGLLWFATFTFFPASVLTVEQAVEINTDRPGGDFRDFAVNGSDSGACWRACSEDAKCAAWTFIKPGARGPVGHCWLKNQIPDPVVDTCCDSGVK